MLSTIMPIIPFLLAVFMLPWIVDTCTVLNVFFLSCVCHLLQMNLDCYIIIGLFHLKCVHSCLSNWSTKERSPNDKALPLTNTNRCFIFWLTPIENILSQCFWPTPIDYKYSDRHQSTLDILGPRCSNKHFAAVNHITQYPPFKIIWTVS